MQAPTAQPTGTNGGQYHIMGGATGQAGGTGCANCGGATGSPSSTSAGQQHGPGLDSSVTVDGQSMSEAVASLFAPGTLDREDALLLWTGVNTLLFATAVYLEVQNRR